MGNWVGGIEADAQISGQGATPSYVCPGAVCNPAIADFDAPVTAAFDQGHKLDSFGTLRGHFGTTITPDVMGYVTGGLAVGSIRSTVRLSGTGFDADGNPGAVSNTFSVLTQKAGWTVGAGLEGRLFGNLTGKIEYLYMDFGTVAASVTNPLLATPITLSSNGRITDNIVRVGLNYKLNPAMAVYTAPAGAPAAYKARTAYKAPVRSAWTWAGFYVGGTIGYGWGKSNTDTAFSDPGSGAQLFATNDSRKLEGAIGGAQGGYNWLAGNVLAGVEADLNYSGQRARMKAVCPGEVCNPGLIGVIPDPSVQAVSEQGQKLEWFATLRGRDLAPPLRPVPWPTSPVAWRWARS